MKRVYIILLLSCVLIGCDKEKLVPNNATHNLTIFFVNDQHGQLENFSKIKHIVDQEKETTNVIVACSGDIFSGNPVVDNYAEKGYPIIDVMNKVGFDISVIGNHEYDYGEAVLKDRLEQATFDWVCANVDMGTTAVPEPLEYKTINVGDLKVTFLGLVETNGKPGATIPSTHPWRVQNFIFERPENVVSKYENIKMQEESDLYIALTHIGHTGYGGAMGDFQLADQFPYFDLIIGGHTNQLLDTIVNGIPIFQAGKYLNYLGKVELSVSNRNVTDAKFELINLNTYPDEDAELRSLIEQYNAEASYLNDVIGYSEIYHGRSQIGCFYTDALKRELNVDVTFQNHGGIRSGLDDGDITKREIFEIDPFNNGTVIYTMSVGEIKNFLMGSSAGVYYSGIQVEQEQNEINILDLEGKYIDDNTNLTVGINDYIPAVNDNYFPSNKTVLSLTTAETIISYLENGADPVYYPSCNRYFRYQ